VSETKDRKYPRTRLRAEVKLSHPKVGEQRTHTRDISEGGAFIMREGIVLPEIGDVVEVQVQGLPGEVAPVVSMRVIRIDKDGVALQFLDAETE
jgi:PilZ domain-containing protein